MRGVAASSGLSVSLSRMGGVSADQAPRTRWDRIRPFGGLTKDDYAEPAAIGA